MPLLTGGGQERNMRAGTESVADIVGIAEALRLACSEMNEENEHTQLLKDYCWNEIHRIIPDARRMDNTGSSLSRILSILFPLNPKTEMLQMSLDIKGIAVSGGSACSSGALGGSHVISHLINEDCVPIRISFCKWNTQSEVDELIKELREILD